MRRNPLFATPEHGVSDWRDAEALNKIWSLVVDLSEIPGKFSCESAADITEIAQDITLSEVTNRSAALLRYYVARIECENGAATSTDHATAKALLAWHDGATAVSVVAELETIARAALADAAEVST